LAPSTSSLSPTTASSGGTALQPVFDSNDNVVFGNPAGSGTTASTGPLFPLSSVPQLSSLPGAKASIYLNFTGDFTPVWGGFSNIKTPAYDIDGDPNTFSQTELNNIKQIWQYVAEDYAPFNINVTTVPPANMGHGFTQQIDIGGSGSWLGFLSGGVSYIGSFTSPSVPPISFVFPGNLGAGYPKYVGDSSSHEAGHAFGLYHQALYDANGNLVNQYNPGPGDGTAPLMGGSYYAPLSRWWLGPNVNSVTEIQDDMAIIASAANGFGYRPDTGNTMGTARTLAVSNGQVSGSGIIIQPTDTNFWSFTTAAGRITLNMNVATGVNNLVAKLALEDANGNIIATADDNSSTAYSAVISANVVGGTYYLVAESHGGYGDVGQYTLSGNIIPLTTTPPSAPAVLIATAGVGQVSLAWTAPAGAVSYNVYRSLTPGGEGATAYKTGVTGVSFTDAGLTNGTTYYYKVTAANSAGESGQSNEASAIPQLSLPAAPSSLTATAGNGQVTLTWNATSGAISYNIYRSTIPGGEGTNSYWNGVKTTSFTDAGLSNGTTYYYQVTAVNAGGESGKSAEALATPQAAVTTVAIHAGGGAVGSFIADTDYSGGNSYSTTHAIDTSGVTSPAPQSVYQFERYGAFTYTIPNLTPGATYTVRLDFAEMYWSAPGKRLFYVKINGSTVLTNFDVFATAGGEYKAVAESFTAVADANGNITIKFVGQRDSAIVSGIEVTPLAGAPVASAPAHSSGDSFRSLVRFLNGIDDTPAASTITSKASHAGSSRLIPAFVTWKSLEQSLVDPFAWTPHHRTADQPDWAGDMLVYRQL
jgi:hypothetical protein